MATLYLLQKVSTKPDQAQKADALRWLRAEFSSRTDARKAVGVRSIVDDDTVYDHLKLLARFTRMAGYAGLLVCVDEMVNLYRIAHTKARQSNYEQVLRILNDTLQGTVQGLGVLFGATTETVTDGRRGLYSYEALQSRLAANPYAEAGVVDFTAPVLKLAPLSQEDFFVLLTRVRHAYAGGDEAKYLLNDDALHAFMVECQRRLGDAYFRTPRTVLVQFLHLLAVVEQNPGVPLSQFLSGLALQPDAPDETSPLDEPDAVAEAASRSNELASFKL